MHSSNGVGLKTTREAIIGKDMQMTTQMNIYGGDEDVASDPESER